MPTLSALTERYGSLPPGDVEWLQRLTGDWQVLSDLAFADLVLWLPLADGGFVVIAQCRPSTGLTVYDDDVVGAFASSGRCERLQAALDGRSPRRSRSSRWSGDAAVYDEAVYDEAVYDEAVYDEAVSDEAVSDKAVPDEAASHKVPDEAASEEAVPVVHAGRPIAVMTRHAGFGGAHTPSRLERNYVQVADDLVAMVAQGEYPLVTAGPAGRGAPRVCDGMLRLDAVGQVRYVSLNALSCLHRLGATGALVGQRLPEVTERVGLDLGDETAPPILLGQTPGWVDVERRGATVAVRAIPLTRDGRRTGAVLLCRDVSELRRRERELVAKDAMIREIHHRVKNSLQTVAALLRLQSRRVASPDARAALAEAMRRVATIAQVHERLSQIPDERVELDDVMRRALRLTADATAREGQVSTALEGTFGQVSASNATALALVVTELVANAVEHGFADGGSGTVRVVADRDGDRLRAEVVDDGQGLPDDLSAGLGTQIVSTLVTNELDGSISWQPGPRGGTSVVVTMQVQPARAASAAAGRPEPDGRRAEGCADDFGNTP